MDMFMQGNELWELKVCVTVVSITYACLYKCNVASM